MWSAVVTLLALHCLGNIPLSMGSRNTVFDVPFPQSFVELGATEVMSGPLIANNTASSVESNRKAKGTRKTKNTTEALVSLDRRPTLMPTRISSGLKQRSAHLSKGNSTSTKSSASTKSSTHQAEWYSMLRFLAICIVEYLVASEASIFVSKRLEIKSTALFVLVNGLIFGMFDPDRQNWMIENFAMPYAKGQIAKRPHTILLSAFSQAEPNHFWSNMVFLCPFGFLLEQSLGTRRFCHVYVASIYCSKAASVWIKRHLHDHHIKDFLRIPYTTPYANCVALGASGAICALNMLYCLWCPLYSKGKKRPAGLAFLTFLKITWRLVSWRNILGDLFVFDHHDAENQYIGRGAHLAGYLSGIVFYCLLCCCERFRMTDKKEPVESESGGGALGNGDTYRNFRQPLGTVPDGEAPTAVVTMPSAITDQSHPTELGDISVV